jgi:hypothetical protein
MNTKQKYVKVHGIACDGRYGDCQNISCACVCHGGISRWERDSRANVAAIKRRRLEDKGY